MEDDETQRVTAVVGADAAPGDELDASPDPEASEHAQPLPAPISRLPAWWGPVIADEARRKLDSAEIDLVEPAIEHGYDDEELVAFAKHEQPLHRYLVIQRIVVHEWAAVYVAVDMITGRTVVLKISRRDTDREARYVVQIKHRNVVTVLDALEHEGYPTIVLEWCSQGTLDDYARWSTEWRPVLERLIEGARGLAFCHARGLVHGDVKLGNFLIDDDVGKLSDLGIARPPTDEGPAWGTIAYAPPERLLGVWSAAGDVFSFGYVIEDALQDFGPVILEPFAALVSKATVTEPEKRPSMVEVIAELEAIAAALDGDRDLLERLRAWEAIEREKAELAETLERERAQLAEAIEREKAESSRRIELAIEASKPRPRPRWQVAGAVLVVLILVAGSIGVGASLDGWREPDPIEAPLKLARQAADRGEASSAVQYLELASQRAKADHNDQGLRSIAEVAESLGHALLAAGLRAEAEDCWLVAYECYAAMNDDLGKRSITALLRGNSP